MNERTRKNLLDLVRKNYSAIAEDFSKSRTRPFWPELVKLIKELVPADSGQQILDIGCGNGRLLDALPIQVQYLGVDSSAELIKIARETHANRESAIFRTGELLELNRLPEINFDLIFCIAVLHHIPSRKLRLEALKQLKSKLGPNGTLVITCWNLWADKRYLKLIGRFWFLKWFGRKHDYDFGDIVFDWQGSPQASRRYYHAFTKGELKRLIKTAGLKLVRLDKDDLNYYLVARKF